MRNQDKFRGCLLGGAAGDALGYEVEFKNERQIFSRYGDRGITAYVLHDGKALISDDTQMTLFTAAGLLMGTTHGNMGKYSDYIRNSYLDWLKTQNQRYPLHDFDSALIASVNHKGDSDSTGAVCGNILGARLGDKGIPEKYTTNLELKDVILEIADDLYHDCQISEYDEKHDETIKRFRAVVLK